MVVGVVLQEDVNGACTRIHPRKKYCLWFGGIPRLSSKTLFCLICKQAGRGLGLKM